MRGPTEMVTTVGPASPDLWDAPWATESVREAYGSLLGESEPDEAPVELPEPARIRRKNRWSAAAAILEATGETVELDEWREPEDLSLYAGLMAEHGMDLPDDPSEDEEPVTGAHAPAESRRRRWAAQHGLPTRRNRPPSDTTEGRRKRHIEQKARRLGISIEEAELLTHRRPNATRAGRVRRLRTSRT